MDPGEEGKGPAWDRFRFKVADRWWRIGGQFSRIAHDRSFRNGSLYRTRLSQQRLLRLKLVVDQKN